MAKEAINMPKLGESVTEGTITTWLVKEGDQVNKYDPLAEVMTDKVNAEIPASFSGVITEIIAAEGETVEVDSLIAYMETEASDEVEANDKADGISNEKKAEENVVEEIDQSMKQRYSPAVLRLAQEHHIDLQTIKGTGRGGRITRKDINLLIKEGLPSEKKEQETETSAPQVSQAVHHSKEDTVIPVSGVRKAIADNMVRSKTEIPHAWMTVEVDVTDLVSYRNQIKESFKQREGYNLTYFAFFVSVVAKALKEFPQLNSTWQGHQIVQHKDVNISIAVASEDQLFVPVIKHADEKSIKGIAREINELAHKARNGKLTVSDMEGGTFTVNNTGTFGSVSSMGIINHPQAAILQVESIVKRPVIINDMFAARDIVNLSLSLDHRILDGLVCGRFMQRVKSLLENINENTTNI